MSVKIMVVDDSEFMHHMIKEIVDGNDYKIVGDALSGKEAIKKYKELKPDIVTMDINMSDMNGIDVVKEIIKIDKEAKIIMCTARNEKSYMKKALEAGAYGYVVKPFLKKDIINIINEIMGIKKVI